jgi:hypothetical protein
MLAMGLLALGRYSLWLVEEHIAIKNYFSNFSIFIFIFKISPLSKIYSEIGISHIPFNNA